MERFGCGKIFNYLPCVSHRAHVKETHTSRNEGTNGCCSLESVYLDSLLEMPKENPTLHSSFILHRCNGPIDLGRDLQKQQTGWFETPKPGKRDASLRRRLMSRSATDGKADGKGCSSKTLEPQGPLMPGCVDVGSLKSPDLDILMGPLSYSTLKSEAMALSCRKRRLTFSQVITSTLEGGKSRIASPSQRDGGSLSEPDPDESIISGLLVSEMPETPQGKRFFSLSKENFQTPINRLAENLSESLSVLSTPTPIVASKNASASEDSGFSSLGLDKSQDSSVDEGSFQEVAPQNSQSREKRRSRLERQRRLSTLRERGSQSEEEQKACRGGPHILKGEEEVFLKTTPLAAARVKLQDLSLTPALQMVHAMSCHSSRILAGHASVEEVLQVSAEGGPIRTTLPLSSLIGRKMGVGKLDILTELSKRNLYHVLAIILQQLTSQDIYQCGQVSYSWDEIILLNKKACRRRKLYEREMKMAQEMGSVVRGPEAETRLTLACRSALSCVQAQAKTPSAHIHTPTATSADRPPWHPIPHASTKHQEFLQVAKTLFSDECLKPCPRCQHPARCHVMRGEGICSWSDCLFHFCTTCLCSFHGSRDCVHLSSKRRSRRDVLPGSAQSKRNVRRL